MSWFKQAFARREVFSDLSAEIQGHLEEKVAELVAAGMPREEALVEARRAFGNVSLTEENSREVWRWGLLEDLWNDLRYGARMLLNSPSFTALAVLTLALGIGANTAIFSVVYAVLLKPLPYSNADQLFNVFQEKQKDVSSGTGWSYTNFAEVREQNRSFSEMAGTQQHQLTLTGRGEPSVVDTSVVTPEFFSVFDAKPLLGRAFFSKDGERGAAPVVVLSEGLWRNFFHSDSNIMGSAVRLDQRLFTVIGIMPATFRFPNLAQSQQIWIPLVQDPLFGSWMPRRDGHWLTVTGRLKPGVTPGQARTELKSLSARLAKEFPAENNGWNAVMLPLQQTLVGNVKSALWVMLGAVGLVLLIACANIANLLLTRGTSRAKEIAVRVSLGAGRMRIIRQLLSETTLLGLLGGAVGVALAYAGVRGLGSLLPANLPQINTIQVDGSVLVFALALSVFASCCFGLAPALFMANVSLQSNLREGGGRAGESGRSRHARNVLAVGEIALAIVLLVGAGLLLRSFSKLMAVSPGFAVQQITKAEVSLPRVQYAGPQQWLAFSDELLQSVRSEPGMHDSAVVIPSPIADGFINLEFDILGMPALSASASRTANYVAATPNYFRVMGIPLLAGRLMSEGDTMAASRITLISKSLARQYFPNQDPIGKKLAFGFPPDSSDPREIVGVVGDVRDVGLGEKPRAMMYVPYEQAPFAGAVIVVKSSLNATAVADAIRRNVAKLDKELPVTDVMTMTDAVEASVAQPKFRTQLLALFAGIALVLAATGIFGVISYSVSCRTREIGVRMALGASRAVIVQMILRETFTLTLAGVLIGIPAALAAARLIEHMLFDVSVYDPSTLLAVTLSLIAVAVLAGYVPVRRAMQVNPIAALRHE
jgi:putative ABC transport system permease protein